MRVGLVMASQFASPTLYPNRIFAPGPLFIDLVNGLVTRGHDVYVFGPPDIETKGIPVSTSIERVKHPKLYHKFARQGDEKSDWLRDEFTKFTFEMDVLTTAFSYYEQGRLDIIHVYHDSSVFQGHYINRVANAPVVYTIHDPLPPKDSFEYGLYAEFARDYYLSISQSQQQQTDLPLNFLGPIYHGINSRDIPFDRDPMDYALFMGRLVPEKGLEDAILATKTTGMHLKIGSSFPDGPGENRYYDSVIEPLLKGASVDKIPVVSGEDKWRLFGNAKALLFPIHWQEAFGMVMIEAMACGTPVIAYNRGSVSEIVVDGLTGFIVDENDIVSDGLSKRSIKSTGVAGLVEALGRIGEIDRQACRIHVEDNFSIERMTKGHERAYGTALKQYLL